MNSDTVTIESNSGVVMQKKKAMVTMVKAQLLSEYPEHLVRVLAALREKYGPLYLSGGSVRDHFTGRAANDLDITVAAESRQCCHDCLALLGGGAYVELGTENEEAARCVWKGVTVDFSSFRGGACSIEEDLVLRDFTINAMAFELFAEGNLLDPLSGLSDLQQGILRLCPGALEADPLRMLRGFRFSAQLGFSLVPELFQEIKQRVNLLQKCAVERIQHEMDLIVESPLAAEVLAVMAECTLLWQLYPELKKGAGLEQGGFHHKDVFAHSLLAVAEIEKIFQACARYFPEQHTHCADYLTSAKNRRLLKWAALFHDLGKPSTRKLVSQKGEEGQSPFLSKKITFHNHDVVGQKLFIALAARYRWSNEDRDVVALLISLHMLPFHLCNSLQKEGVSTRAFLRLYKKAGPHLPGLFVLAMADLQASNGPLCRPDMPHELNDLFQKTIEIVERAIVPVVMGDKLLGGDDLIAKWNLPPGPLFREILDGIELARVEGRVVTYEDAVAWVDNFLLENGSLPL